MRVAKFVEDVAIWTLGGGFQNQQTRGQFRNNWDFGNMDSIGLNI
jgi:hypothetical protein